jgi:hypothetical protein
MHLHSAAQRKSNSRDARSLRRVLGEKDALLAEHARIIAEKATLLIERDCLIAVRDVEILPIPSDAAHDSGMMSPTIPR